MLPRDLRSRRLFLLYRYDRLYIYIIYYIRYIVNTQAQFSQKRHRMNKNHKKNENTGETLMEIILVGACGKMGREVAANLRDGMHIAASVDIKSHFRDIYDYGGKADVIIDFSSHSATERTLSFAVSKKIPCVIATTGQSEAEHAAIKKAALVIPVFYSENMSFGAAVLLETARAAASLFPDAEIEITEKHHAAKANAPSGTALMLARELSRGGRIVCGRNGDGKRQRGDIGISSVRIGKIIGYHEVMISNGRETLVFSHDVHERSVFARGAVAAADFISQKSRGLYGMYDMIHLG